MDKYLLLLLKEVNTIIIPDLGALTITNHSTGEIMFMPYLKYDDGKLAAYISEKEGFELNDAKNLIAKYVRDVQAVLDRGESYDMFQFGTFLKDSSGDVVFKNWDGSLPSEVKIEVAEETLANENLAIEETNQEEVKELVVESIVENNEEIQIESLNEEEVTSEKEVSINNHGYQNDIEGIYINSEKELELKIGDNHIIALRNSGKVEMLKNGVVMENYADTLPKPEIKHTPKVSKEDIRAERLKAKETVQNVEETKIEAKEENKEIEEVKVVVPVEEKVSTPIVPKAELTPEEAEAKRIKNAQREADREKRLAERMEKLAMKGMPSEEVETQKSEEENKPEQKGKIEEAPKKEESKKNKKEAEVKTAKKGFIVQKTANQKSSIKLATSIIIIGIVGGLGVILLNSGDITAPKLAESKELAENNKNVENKVNTTTEETTTTTEVVETTEDVEIPVAEEVIVEEEAKVSEPVKVETPKKTVVVPAPTPTPAPVNTSNSYSSGKYHIIGGSFSIEANASNFANQMSAKGMDAKVLGKIDKMFVVSLGAYDSKSEAISDSKAKNIKGWILSKNNI